MKSNKLFEQFDKINELLEGHLTEISVKQHQVTIMIHESLLEISPLMDFLDSINDYQDTYITTKDEVFYVTIGGLSIDSISKKNILYPFVETITSFSEKICTCPSLEFVIAKEYIKCFLDKPGLRVSDLKLYEEILGQKEKGELQLLLQRPYLLFINDNFGR